MLTSRTIVGRVMGPSHFGSARATAALSPLENSRRKSAGVDTSSTRIEGRNRREVRALLPVFPLPLPLTHPLRRVRVQPHPCLHDFGPGQGGGQPELVG